MSITKHAKAFGKVVLFLVAAVVVGGSIDYGYMFWQESQGYCRKSGTILDERQRFRAALDDYLLNQQVRDLLEIGAVEITDHWPGLDEIKRDFTVIPYSSRSDFLATNPQCCQLTWQTPAGVIGAWEKANGYGDGWFYFTHKIRYTDRAGVAKEIAATRTYYQVNNCGYALPKFYH